MKYYSEELQKTFDTEEECVAAEKLVRLRQIERHAARAVTWRMDDAKCGAANCQLLPVGEMTAERWQCLTQRNP